GNVLKLDPKFLPFRFKELQIFVNHAEIVFVTAWFQLVPGISHLSALETLRFKKRSRQRDLLTILTEENEMMHRLGAGTGAATPENDEGQDCSKKTHGISWHCTLLINLRANLWRGDQAPG